MSPATPHAQEEQLLELAYGELAPAEAGALQAHVRGCAQCRTQLDAIGGVRRAMAPLGEAPAPDAGLASLLAYAQQAAGRNAEARKAPGPRRGARWLLALVPLGAAALVSLVVLRQVPDADRAPAPQASAVEGAPAAAGGYVPSPPPPPVLSEAQESLASRGAGGEERQEAARELLAFRDADPRADGQLPDGFGSSRQRRASRVQTATNASPAPAAPEVAEDAAAGQLALEEEAAEGLVAAAPAAPAAPPPAVAAPAGPPGAVASAPARAAPPAAGAAPPAPAAAPPAAAKAARHAGDPLQEAARARARGDRAAEAALLSGALAEGRLQGEARAPALLQLCEARLALGLQAEAEAACRQLLADFPSRPEAATSRRLLGLPAR
jgi:hypothetical protein